MSLSPFNGSSKGRIEEFVLLLVLKKVGGQHARKGALERARAGKTSSSISDLTWACDHNSMGGNQNIASEHFELETQALSIVFYPKIWNGRTESYITDSAEWLWIGAREMFLNEVKQHYLTNPSTNPMRLSKTGNSAFKYSSTIRETETQSNLGCCSVQSAADRKNGEARVLVWLVDQG